MSEEERYLWACANRYTYVLGSRNARGEIRAVTYQDRALECEGTNYASYKLQQTTALRWVLIKKGKTVWNKSESQSS